MGTSVLLADDHILVRQGLRSLLDRENIRVIAEAPDGQEVIRLAESLHPDIAIMDISMPTLNGIDAARVLAHSCPKTRVIFLTQHEEEQYLHEALEAGVRGYILKSQVVNDLVHAIRQVSSGGFYLSPGVSQAVVEAYRSRPNGLPIPSAFANGKSCNSSQQVNPLKTLLPSWASA